ncbi:hypothetical protein [Actinoalloteichus caeruleus]|nr:hypothetical protein [Actinoalloteichus caeruleus]
MVPNPEVADSVTMLMPRVDARPASRVRRYVLPWRARRVRPFLGWGVR